MIAAAAMRMDTPMFSNLIEMISPDLVWGSFCSKRCAAPRTPPLLSGCALGGGADQASSFLLSSGGLQLVGGAPSADLPAEFALTTPTGTSESEVSVPVLSEQMQDVLPSVSTPAWERSRDDAVGAT